ncbi:hypothetical protein PQX77_015413 [Marasmius sp. AFHP31]|nr:hypothetical protein PQX77_015413 [Marasmius sp. AFHP31]
MPDEISLQYLAEMKPKKSKCGGDAPAAFPTGRPATMKAQYIVLLMNWRLNRDFKSQADLIPTSTTETLNYIQRVIKDTVVLSWVNSVPKNFGEAKAGTLKADDRRTLSSIYLPIALVTLWVTPTTQHPHQIPQMKKACFSRRLITLWLSSKP